MTKSERKKIESIIKLFLSNDDNAWGNGMNELYMLAFGKTRDEMMGFDKLTPIALSTLYKQLDLASEDKQ